MSLLLILLASTLSQRSQFPLSPVVSDARYLGLGSQPKMGGAYECTAASSRADREGNHTIVIQIGGAPSIVRFKVASKSTATVPEPDPVADIAAIPNVLYGTDNQTVRLWDNRLMMMRDSVAIGPFRAGGRPPIYHTAQITWRDTVKAGARGALASVSSSDNGANWGTHSVIDLAVFAGGKYGIPRPMSDDGKVDVAWENQGKNADGTPKYWIGGMDRTELYSCPFTGNLYLTTRIISGPFTKSQSQVNTGLILASQDRGQTWTEVGTLSAWSPMTMTTTRDGRLWILQSTGETNRLTVSEPVAQNGLPKGFQWVTGTAPGQPAKGPKTSSMEIKVGHPSIARLLTPSPQVLFSYQVQNADGNQEYRIMRGSINNGKPAMALQDEIKPKDPKTQSAMFGSFIEPELNGEAPAKFTDTTLFYFYEAPLKWQDKSTMRYVLFRDGKPTHDGVLHRKKGVNAVEYYSKAPGDYTKGTSFLANDGSLVFVPQYTLAERLWATTVMTQP